MDNTYEKYTAELDEYITNTKGRLSAILSTLGWNEVDTLKKTMQLQTAENKDDPNDPPLPESFVSMHSIVIGEDKLKQILKTNTVVVPQKFSDIQLNFSREQKLALYDYVVLHTGKISEPELKVSDNRGNDGMTFAEIVAKAKKNDKKLKRKYRTSKPTHIEEVRNLVHLQMQALAQYFNPRTKREERSDLPGYSGHRRVRQRSRSLSRDRKRPRHERERSRSGHKSKKYRKRSRSHDEHKRHSKKKHKNRSRSPHKSSKSKKHKQHHKSKKH